MRQLNFLTKCSQLEVGIFLPGRLIKITDYQSESPHRYELLPGVGFALSRRGQHIFNKDSISHSRVIDEDMGDGTHDFPILQNGAATHE